MYFFNLSKVVHFDRNGWYTLTGTGGTLYSGTGGTLWAESSEIK